MTADPLADTQLSADELLTSRLFDADWYIARYPDAALMDRDPLEHFLWLGHRLGRDPGPEFCGQDYLRRYPDVAQAGIDPLWHYLRAGRAEGRKASAPAAPRPWSDNWDAPLAGARAHRPGRPTVLLCSHAAGETLFGGERSLLDVLGGLDRLGVNVVVSVPTAAAAGYCDAIRTRATALYVVPCPWWHKNRPPAPSAIAHFAAIIADEQVDAVHVNTLVLREPLLAARHMDVPALVHVREILEHDTALLASIGVPADTIPQQVWDNSDRVIVNSRATGQSFTLPGRTPDLIYNIVDFDELVALPPPAPGPDLRVGLISSNIAKKGVADFVRIAHAMWATHPRIRFQMIGPDTDLTRDIAARVAGGTLPDSLRLLGYRDRPADAVAEVDVVLNLSEFHESFGRTVLEGMAAARPVVVYARGALPELVRDGQTGFIVPPGDTGAVVARLAQLADNPDLVRDMGRAAQADARARFGTDVFDAALRGLYAPLLPGLADSEGPDPQSAEPDTGSDTASA